MKRHMSVVFVLLSGVVVTVCDGANDIQLPRTAFEVAMTEAAAGDPGPVLRRVWSGVTGSHDFACGGPSPDGKLFSLVDWETGDLAVFDLRTGEVRHVTNKGTWNENGSWNECSIFSPDGRRVLFNYGKSETVADGYTYELRVLGLDEPLESQKTVMQLPPNLGWLAPADWRDDEILALACTSAAEPNQLVAMSASGENRRVIREVEGKLPFPARYAPDGETIAYQLGSEIRLVGRDGANDRDSGLGEAKLVGWSAPETLLVHVPSAGEIRAATLEGGSFGAPEVIGRDLTSAFTLGIGGDRVFFGVAVQAERVHTAAIDWENGRVSAPVPLVSTIDGESRFPAWSPDGRTLAYLHSPLGSRSTGIVLRSASGNEVQHLTDVPMTNPANLVWDPSGDGLWLLANGDVAPALYRVDVDSGSISKVFEGMGTDLAIDADGTIYFHRPPAEGVEAGLHAYDPDTGAMRRIIEDASFAGARNLSVAPDGRSIAYSRFDSEAEIYSLFVITIETGASRELLRVPVPDYITSIAHTMVWSPDGGKLLYRRRSGDRATLEMVDVQTGESTTVFESTAPVVHVTLHPDGRQLALRAGQSKTELWTLELPK